MKLNLSFFGTFLVLGHRDQSFVKAQSIIRKLSKKDATPSQFPILPPEPQADTCPLQNGVEPLVHISKTRTLLDEDVKFVIGEGGNAVGSQTITKAKYYNAAALYFDEDGTLVNTTEKLGTVTTTCTVKQGSFNNRGEIVVNTFECVDKACSGDDTSNCVSSQSIEEFNDGFVLGGSERYFSRLNGEITCGTGLYEGLSKGHFSSTQVLSPSRRGGPAVFENKYTIEFASGPSFSAFETMIDNVNGDEKVARSYIEHADQLNLCNIDVVTSLINPSNLMDIFDAYTSSLQVKDNGTGNSFDVFYSQDMLLDYSQKCDDVGLRFKTYPEILMKCSNFDVRYYNFAQCTTNSDSCAKFDLIQFLLEYNNVIEGYGCEISTRKLASPLPKSTSTLKDDLDSSSNLAPIEARASSIQARTLEEQACPEFCSEIQCGMNFLCASCPYCDQNKINPITRLPNDLCDTYCSQVQCGLSPMCSGCSFCNDDIGPTCKNVQNIYNNPLELPPRLCALPQKIAGLQQIQQFLRATGLAFNNPQNPFNNPLVSAFSGRLAEAVRFDFTFNRFPNLIGVVGDPCDFNECSGCFECKYPVCDSWCSKVTCGGPVTLPTGATILTPVVPNCVGCSFCKNPNENTGSPCADYCSRRQGGSAACSGCTFKDAEVCDSFCHVTNNADACRDCKENPGQPLYDEAQNLCDSYCNALTCGFGQECKDKDCIDVCGDCDQCKSLGAAIASASTSQQGIGISGVKKRM